MVPLEVDDAIEVEYLEEVEAEAVGVGHREDRENDEQLRMFNPDYDTYFFSFWKEPRKREKTELIRKREVDRSRMKVIEYRIATRIEKLEFIN